MKPYSVSPSNEKRTKKNKKDQVVGHHKKKPKWPFYDQLSSRNDNVTPEQTISISAANWRVVLGTNSYIPLYRFQERLGN